MCRVKGKKFNLKIVERILLLLLVDIAVIHAASFLALFVRFEFSPGGLANSGFLSNLHLWILPNTVATVVIFALLRLYTSLWAFAGVDELERVFFAALLSGILQIAAMLAGLRMPRSYPVLYGMFLLLMTMGTRFAYRLVRGLRTGNKTNNGIPTMLIGAGDAGAVVLREFQNSRFSHNNVVCIIDDDPAKHRRSLMGVSIVGGREDIAAMAKAYHVSEIVLAIPTLPPGRKRRCWSSAAKPAASSSSFPVFTSW